MLALKTVPDNGANPTTGNRATQAKQVTCNQETKQLYSRFICESDKIAKVAIDALTFHAPTTWHAAVTILSKLERFIELYELLFCALYDLLFMQHWPFTPEEDDTIIRAHARFGNIKNHWNSTLKRKCSALSDNLSTDAHDQHPLKRSASVRAGTTISCLYLNPSSPSGSDLSDSSLPAMSPTQVYRPFAMSATLVSSTHDQVLSLLKSKSTDHLNSFASELVAVVFADGSVLGGPRLSFADGLWVDKSHPLKPSFKQVMDTLYKAALAQVDFQRKAVEVTQKVKSWAEKETNGLIRDVLPPGSVDSSTRLIFANALYFKGTWNEKFDASKTKDDDFYLLNGSSVKVPFMTSKKKQFIGAFDGFKVLRLLYKQGEDKRQFSMYFFLPDAKDGLPALVEKVGTDSGFLERHIPFNGGDLTEMVDSPTG